MDFVSVQPQAFVAVGSTSIPRTQIDNQHGLNLGTTINFTKRSHFSPSPVHVSPGRSLTALQVDLLQMAHLASTSRQLLGSQRHRPFTATDASRYLPGISLYVNNPSAVQLESGRLHSTLQGTLHLVAKDQANNCSTVDIVIAWGK
jgi:hypothetical protein